MELHHGGCRMRSVTILRKHIFPAFAAAILISLMIGPADAMELNGKVTDPNSNGVSALVELFRIKDGVLVYSIQTEASGRFRFQDVKEMDYAIRLSGMANYPDQWYSPWEKTVNRQYATRIDIAMITDTLRMEVTESPLNNLSNNRLTVNLTDSTGSTITDNSGFYVTVIRRLDYFEFPIVTLSSGVSSVTFDTLQSAEYYVKVQGSGFPEQYYDPERNTSFAGSAITISGGASHTITLRMVDPPEGDAILNGICLSETDTRLSGIPVFLCQPFDTFRVIYTTSTDDHGAFSFRYIVSTNYYLKLAGTGYPVQWFSKNRNATTRYPDDELWPMHYAGDTVSIRLSTSPIDNPSIGSVTIFVRDSTGSLLSPPGKVLLIDLYTSISHEPGYDATQKFFQIRDLSTGKYCVQFTFPPYPTQYYAPGYNTATPSYTQYVSSSDSIVIDSKLSMNLSQNSTTQTYGFVKASVHDSLGPVPNAMINIINGTQGVIQTGVSLADGTCKTLRIPAQEIAITVQAAGYPMQFWSPQGMTSTLSIENRVYINSDDTFYFDAYLVPDPLNSGASTAETAVVHGKVTEAATGNPLAGIRIVLFDQFEMNDINTRTFWSPWSTTTDSSGQFYLSNIPYGTYRCLADADTLNYIAQFYSNSDFLNSAQNITFDNNSTTSSVNFSMRRGSILKGTAVSTSGTGIGNARIEVRSNDNSRWFETWTSSNGSWSVNGIPKGSWHVWVNHERYIPVEDNQKREFDISEGTTTSVPTFTLEAGGYLVGSFTSELSLYDTGIGNPNRGSIIFFSDPDNSGNTVRWPDYQTGIQFDPDTSGGADGSFRSNAVKAGQYRICFYPQPLCWNYPEKSKTVSLLPNYGYSFLGSVSPSTLPPSFRIIPDDSVTILSIFLRKGFSIFGTLHNEDGTAIAANFGIEAMIKRDSTWYLVSQGAVTSEGRFELPGLVDGEEYYLVVWADGYNHQFWSPEGNSINPDKPFRFNAAGFTPLSVAVVKNPAGIDPSRIQGPLSLWIEGDSLGYPLLYWKNDPALSIDSYSLYRIDRTGTISTCATISRSAASSGAKYRDTNPIEGWRDYIVVGKGTALTVRSNRTGFDSRSSLLSSDNQIWIDAVGDRWGVAVEWGMRDQVSFTSSDSVNVYKAVGADPFKLVIRRPAGETWLHDDTWDRSDSGKTYTYYLEIPSRSIVSDKVPITLNASFIAGLTRTLTVGPYEQYRKISDAVTAANDFDNIEVRSGTYFENISLKGKILSINGSWDYGKPPVIDAGGGIAVTVPVCLKGNEWDRPRISGFIIRNSSTGLRSFSPVEISECLFDNVSNAISMIIDSTPLLQQIKSNPFKANILDAQVYHCTFIAQKTGSLVATATSVGIAEQSGYSGTYSGLGQFYITPTVSLATKVSIEKSSIAFYQSNALLSYLPVSLQGNSTRIALQQCNLWKTATVLRSSGIEPGEKITSLDPQFADTTEWFVAASSPLAGSDWDSWIGYDVRKYNFNDGGSDELRPTTVSNVSAAVVGLNRIFLRWTAAPAEENVTRYRIYRVPGDPALFYINQRSEWDLKIKEDSLFSVIDTFSTTATAFLDTTVNLGKPYLYVVAAVNGNGAESEINLPAPPDITTYFVNSYTTQVKLPSGKWHMIGAPGGSTLTLSSTTGHALFDWDDRRIPDKTFSQYGKGYRMQPGSGYWFKPAVDTAISMSATALDALKSVETTIRLPLKKGATGWNLVSSPFPFSIAPEWLAGFNAWEWNTDSIGYRKATSLKPWKGYWIYTERDTALQLWKKQPLSYYQTQKLAKTAKSAPAIWQLRLSLRRKNSYDTDNFIGVIPSALQKTVQFSTPEPPAAFDAARLYLIDHLNESGNTRNPSGLLAQLYKAQPEKNSRLEWLVGMNASDVSSELSISGIENIPEKYYIFWVEENRVINIREQSQLTIDPNTTESFGYIVVTSNPADLAMYSNILVLARPYPNPFKGSTTIQYTLPYSWTGNAGTAYNQKIPVSLSVYDITGKHIIDLVKSIQKPGIYRSVWNGENSCGGATAAGLYLFRLQYGNRMKIARCCRIK